ncbi:hypothetical protein E3N88_24221 [Mikania micrantha]|uniref:Uncharacterized protein n=1 Tax=Mikania micrantha TaxID=192012 RepID=A0A5N6NH51_9ASTR|nr:hypothetical protein E3N88_24221 [Mikania micrantha]
MKLGLSGSAETHRGTRWAPNWAFAVREDQAEEFEFSEIHRNPFWKEVKAFGEELEAWDELGDNNHHHTRLGAAVKTIPDLLEALHLCSSFISVFLSYLEVVLAPLRVFGT